ncbi:hypothetical protein OS493_010675 [Desmophyllum pertusum]|uniref:CUE domain-containing protein n=1 Tax=Desmophyllum pertusum TaxID=174260 RepID=A0A9W9ZR36_9CNID|nr:hypothetical protein OS493_010675 [Desmophyllum pertusum]
MSEMEDEVFSSPYKPVPQSMIDNVMSICPHVDPKDVAKDLVITGSATRTINRILDGQFPAVVNIDVGVENTLLDTRPQDPVERHAVNQSVISKNSTMSVNRGKLKSNADSSDTDVYTDTDDDDDDDIMIVQEERKSLFSALKSRMNDRESEKRCTQQSKSSAGRPTARETSYRMDEDTCSKKRSTKNKRTSSIVDLSFSDDDKQEEYHNNQNNNYLHSYATKTQTTDQGDCVLIEAQKQQTNKARPLQKEKNAGKEYSEKHGRNFVESSPSNHDTDSCEDNDDLPCILPSSSHSGRSSHYSCTSYPSSCTDNNYKSSDSQVQGSNLESQDDSQIPMKRKKDQQRKSQDRGMTLL